MLNQIAFVVQRPRADGVDELWTTDGEVGFMATIRGFSGVMVGGFLSCISSIVVEREQKYLYREGWRLMDMWLIEDEGLMFPRYLQ